MDRETAEYLRKNGMTWRDLYDYPMSWDNWRRLCVYYGDPDPGPCEPPEHSVDELHERLAALEESRQPQPQWTRQQWDQVQQLRAQITYLQTKVNALLDKRTKRDERKTRSVLKGIET